MFNLEDFTVDFLTKGFYRFDASMVLQSFDLKTFMPIKSTDRSFKTNDPAERLSFYTDLQKGRLLNLAKTIQDVYIPPYMKTTICFNDMWSRVTSGVHGWHSDHMRAWKGFNASLNCYFDESTEDTGGMLQLHPSESYIPEDSENIYSVYPKKFDIVILNQTPGFVHRVSPCNIERRILSYVCAFHDFNPPD